MLTELGLARVSVDVPTVELLEAARTDLEASATYRAYAARFATTERALAAVPATTAHAA